MQTLAGEHHFKVAVRSFALVAVTAPSGASAAIDAPRLSDLERRPNYANNVDYMQTLTGKHRI